LAWSTFDHFFCEYYAIRPNKPKPDLFKLVMLLIALSYKDRHLVGWLSIPVLLPLLASFALVFIFYRVESAVKEPIMPTSLLKQKNPLRQSFSRSFFTSG
jgi:hypothetical protein